MAIVKNFWLVNQKKKLAGAVIYQAMGQTRSRELAASVSNPRTQAQMEQRVKWGNLVNFYRANANWMKFAYESKATNQSEYNKFMSLNVPNSRIYLPKSIARQGGCIVDAYQMTQGSLASVEIVEQAGGWATNIWLQSAGEIGENSTIGEWTQQILPANPALREGDQISFIRFTQQTNATTGVPFVVVRKYEVILNSDDTRRFYDFMPYEYIGTSQQSSADCMAVEDSGNAGGFLICISRTVGGRTYVSSQNIIVANNSALIDAYSSSNALQSAIDSYGESEEPFLTSTTADIDSQAAVRPSIVSVRVGADIKPLGQSASLATLENETGIDATFSNFPEGGTVTSAKLHYYEGGMYKEASLGSLGEDGSTVSGEVILTADATNIHLADIVITISGTEYRGVWVVPNSATIRGLE